MGANYSLKRPGAATVWQGRMLLTAYRNVKTRPFPLPATCPGYGQMPIPLGTFRPMGTSTP
jgi:hypothetical protein